MTRHIVDHRDTPEGGRLKHYLALERRASMEAGERVLRTLGRRPVGTLDQNRRAAEFMRIARGHLV